MEMEVGNEEKNCDVWGKRRRGLHLIYSFSTCARMLLEGQQVGLQGPPANFKSSDVTRPTSCSDKVRSDQPYQEA
jgi:hypothetical protein